MEDNKNTSLFIGAVILLATLAGGFYWWTTKQATEPPVQNVEITTMPDTAALEKQAVHSMVTNFGARLKNVPLTAPKADVVKLIKENYASFVTPELLAAWTTNPASAPGRRTSSPWPDRIEITSTKRVYDTEYQVTGEIVEVTSAELSDSTATAARAPITLTLIKSGNSFLINSVNILPYAS